MADPEPKPSEGPVWARQRPSVEEAVYFLELRSEELRGEQHRLVRAGYRMAPDVETMREAFVLRHLASQLRYKLFKDGKSQP